MACSPDSQSKNSLPNTAGRAEGPSKHRVGGRTVFQTRVQRLLHVAAQLQDLLLTVEVLLSP